MLKILAVEDNPGDQALLKEAIAETGIKCELFFSPAVNECIGELYTKKPNVVLMDINLPGLHGDDFAAMIQNGPYTTNSMPIVFLTGATLPENQMDPLTSEIKIGDRNYLVLKKPVNVGDLKKALACFSQ